MAAEVHVTATTFEVGAPKLLFRPQLLGGLGGGPSTLWRYDTSKDGQRFLINTAGDDKSSTPITVTTQWTELLKK